MAHQELETIGRQIAFDLVRLSHQTQTAHLGSNLSIVPVLTCLYFAVMTIQPRQPKCPQRDRFILSKGHASPAHYMTLAHRGFFDIDDVFALATEGSCFEEHSGIDAPPGVETVNGSLGHGLGLAAGLALSAQLRQEEFSNFVLMGDGEINEGSVWEAAMFIAANNLHQVTALIDHNKWQATGRSQEIFGLKQISQQWQAFGWDALDVDGRDYTALEQALYESKKSLKPSAIIVHSLKGQGVSFMEDNNNWHYKSPSTEEVIRARQELLGH